MKNCRNLFQNSKKASLLTIEVDFAKMYEKIVNIYENLKLKI